MKTFYQKFYNEGFIWLVLAYIAALIIADHAGFFKEKPGALTQLFNTETQLSIRVDATPEEKQNRIDFPAIAQINGKKVKFLTRLYRQDSGINEGDVLKVDCRVLPLPVPRNPGQFDYGNYLLRKGFSGILSTRKHEVIEKGKPSFFGRSIDRLRRSMVNSIRNHVDSDVSGVLEAMFVGEKSEIPAEVSADFMDSGLMHVLVVSGMNVAYVVAIFFLLFRFLPVSNILRNVLLVVPVLAYCFATGANPPVVRATVISLTMIACYLLSREKAVYHALALSALIILLFDPQALFGASMQLSYAACLGLVYIAPKLINPFYEPMVKSGKRWLFYLLSLFLVTLSAQIATAPLLAKYFYKVSAVGLVSNLVVVPYVGIILWLCFTQYFAYLFLPVLLPVTSYVCWLSGEALLKMTGFFADVPLANVNVGAPSTVFIIVYYAALALLFKLKTWRLRAALCAAFIAFLVLNSLFFSGRGRFSMTFLDVGQGDSIFIKTAGNENIFVDCGGDESAVGKWVYSPFLLSQGVAKIDKIIITTDRWTHYAGLNGLIDNFKIGEIYVPKQGTYTYELERAIQKAKEKGIAVKTLDDWENTAGIEVYKPFKGIIRVKSGAFSALLTSDSELGVLPGEIGAVNVLQVPAHGKKIPDKRILDKLKPNFLVVSSDRPATQPKGYPPVYSTASTGAITFIPGTQYLIDRDTFKMIKVN